MPWFPKPSSPSTAFRDLFAFMRHSSREQKIGAALALIATGIIVFEFLIDSRFGAVPPRQEVVVQLYPANRTDADIIADQKKEMAERARFEKEKQRQFQKLEKQLGM